jgi:phosphoadenosine phosphosulfate reductase
LLIENTLFGLKDKVKEAIQILKDLKPEWLCFSGGKDSIIIKRLAIMAKIKFESHYNITTIDPPDLIRFMNRCHKDVIRDKPERPLLKQMLIEKIPPNRIIRWCCRLYKEKGGDGKFVITGLRAAESWRRGRRQIVELCKNGTGKRYMHPIFNWSDAEVWEFIKAEGLPYCSLYDEGWKRIGCLMCPMGRKKRLLEAKRYPHITKNFIKHFELLYEINLKRGKDMTRWANGEDMFYWWLKDEPTKKEIPDQTTMFE